MNANLKASVLTALLALGLVLFLYADARAWSGYYPDVVRASPPADECTGFERLPNASGTSAPVIKQS